LFLIALPLLAAESSGPVFSTAVRLDDQNVVSAHSETLALWLAVVRQLG
jgi:hypothetical protein